MNKKRRRWYRTIRHVGQVRDWITTNVDRRTDPDYFPRLPPIPAPVSIVVDGNYNEIAPSTVKNRWGRIRGLTLETSEKIRRLTLRRLRRRHRRRQKHA